jgi:hypothetical protein
VTDVYFETKRRFDLWQMIETQKEWKGDASD